MNKLTRFFKSLQFIFRPKFWLMNHPYNKHWDEQLNKLLDRVDVKPVDDFTHTIGGVGVWTSNYPYAYGHLYRGSRANYYRPSRLTILRLRDAVEKCKREELIKMINEINNNHESI